MAVEVVNDAGLVLPLPVGKRSKTAVTVADGFVSELEQVREEEGNVVERLPRPGHVSAGVLALAGGVVPVLDAARTEDGLWSQCDVAGGVDIWIGRLKELVDDHAIPRRERRGLCKCDVGCDPDAGDQQLSENLSARSGSCQTAVTVPLDGERHISGQHLDTFTAI